MMVISRLTWSRPGLVLAATIAFCGFAATQTAPTWRYDLRPGDRLVYSYSFHRQFRSDDAESKTEARFHTQVVVTGAHEDIISVGFQRNREAADLLVYREKGKDRLSRERPDFEKRMQRRPAQFSEAMELNELGEPRYSWEIARESSSHLLPSVHEIELLPPRPVAPGQRWPGVNPLGLEFEWAGSETLHGKKCYRIRGATRDGAVTLSYWWSPESGVVERVELDGRYEGTIHEQVRIELESRSRNEDLSGWLSRPETRLAALQALLLSPQVPVTGDQLQSAIETDTDEAQLLAIAVAQHRGLALSATALNKLTGSTNPLVRQDASEMLGHNTPKPEPQACAPSLPLPKLPAKFGTLLRAAKAEKSESRVAYFLRVPATYRPDRPAPLLVFLSGGAGFALDGVNNANDAISSTDYLVLYPQAGDYWWKPEVAKRVDAEIRDAMNEFSVDRNRVYIAGFSNGGTGALYMAELWPQRFAAAVSLMGAGQCNEDVHRALPNLLNLPMLFLHGDKDARISSECSKGTSAALTEMHPRVAPQLHVFPDREHEITLQSDDGMTLAFLKDKVRDAFPKRLSLRLPDLAYSRQYWVEILEKKSGVAQVEAEVKPPNRLEIHSQQVTRLRLHLRPEMFSQPGSVRIRWNGKQVYEGPIKDACTAGSSAPDPELDLFDRKDFSLP